jgi:CHAT domain
MSSDSARRALEQAQRNRDNARKRHADAVKKQATLEGEIGRLQDRIAKATSDGIRRTYESQLRTKNGQLDRARTDITRRLGDVNAAEKKVTVAEAKLRNEEAAEQKKAERKADQERRRDEQRRRQEEREERLRRQRAEQTERRAEQERARREGEQARQLVTIEGRTKELEERVLAAERQAAPPEVAVLFLAASPEDLAPLRLDKETREIEKRVRASELRDSIWFRSRMARQLPDLIEDMNEVRPVIVHFSGHGSDAALAFEDEEGRTHPLDNERLGKLLDATAGDVRLIVFNSCDSSAQAELAVAHVDLAIGMDTAINDEDAKVFAGQLYSSIGYGRSVGEAFRQAKVQIELAGGDGDAPTLHRAEGIDPELVVLVNPDVDLD